MYGSICFYADTSEENAKFKTYVEQENEDVIGSLGFIENMILDLGQNTVESMIKENEDLEKYRFYIEELFRKKEHAITSPEITEIKKEILSIIQKYNDTLMKVSFEAIIVNGKKIELSIGNIPKYLASSDEETRRQTYLSLNDAYRSVEDELIELINKLYKKRVKLAKLLGYANVLEMALDEEAIDVEIIKRLISLVDENKPLLQKYVAEKTRLLELFEPYLYDLGMSLNNNSPKKYLIEEITDLLKKAFKPIGSKYLTTALELLESGHIDSQLRENKHSRTFSWYSYSSLNYRSTYKDVKDLVHELGHSINDTYSLKLPFPYRISSVFTGEIASIVNEILLNRVLLNEAESEDEKLYYLSKEIDNFVTSVYRQTMYTEFECELYAKIESGEILTKEFLNETYMRIIKSYYGKDIIYDSVLSSEWMRLMHQINWTFYSYRYATGLLIASVVTTNLFSGELTENEYLDFLSSGFKESPIDLLKKLHIDLKDLGILKRGFDILKSDLETLAQFKPDKHITYENRS